MTLAEALILRADLQKRMEQLQQRVLRNVRVQHGDEPAESPDELISEYEAACDALQDLIRRINVTNLRAEVAPDLTLTDALAKRDVLRMRISFYRHVAEAASIQHDRFTRSEIRFVSTVDVRAVQAQADALSRAYRELEAQIQATNWRVSLVE